MRIFLVIKRAAWCKGTRSPLSMGLLAALVLGLSGCRFLLSVEDPQCRSDAECVARFDREWTCGSDLVCRPPPESEPPSDGDMADAGEAPLELPDRWACLTEPKRQVRPMADETISLRFLSVDYTSLTVPPGLTANVCRITDVDCQSPLLSDVVPAADDYLEFDVPHGFNGYFELAADSVLPGLYYNNRPFTEDEEFSGPILSDADTAQRLSERGDVGLDLTKGIVIFSMFDCEGNAAESVTLLRENGDPDEVFYFAGSLPDRDLRSTRISNALSGASAPVAAAGILNIEPGFHSFEAVHAEYGLSLGTFTADLRGGQITTVFMYAGY